MQLSVIVATYNSPEWLKKVIWGYMYQSMHDFELLIADDGSTSETADLIQNMRKYCHFPILHIWHEDRGFNKCKILNKAIIKTSSDYLIFSDGDCIPRKDFLQKHYDNRRIGCFLSGGAIRLPMALSKSIHIEHVAGTDAFNRKWLLSNGLKGSVFKNLKLTQNKRLSKALNHISPTKATWNGGNSSAWKNDILSVNGFNECMHYYAEDREFGERLTNKGVHGVQIRYSTVCIHLDHTRDYLNEDDLKKNKEIYQNTIKTKSKWTSYGIIKLKKDE